MIRTISAEFDSLDKADLVGGKIKRSFGGIKDIKIIDHNNDNLNRYNPFGHFAVTSNNPSNYYPFSFGMILNQNPDSAVTDNNSGNYDGRSEVKKSVSLEINCADEDLSAVSRLIISEGGLNVKKT